MSIAVMTAVFRTGLPPSEKVVALALADHAHDDGTEARPGMTSLATKCSLSERQVLRVVKSLLFKGVISVQREGSGRRPHCYRFRIDRMGNLRTPSGDNLSVLIPDIGDIYDTVVVTPEVPSSDTDVTQTIRTVNEPSSSLSTASDGRSSRDNTPYEREFEDAWLNYPRKSGKVAAYRSFLARVRSGDKPIDLTTAAFNYAKLRRGEDQKFTLLGSTFWGPQQRWRDFLPGGAGIVETPTRENIEDEINKAVAFLLTLFELSPESVSRPLENILADKLFDQFSRTQLGRMNVREIRSVLAALVYAPKGEIT